MKDLIFKAIIAFKFYDFKGDGELRVENIPQRRFAVIPAWADNTDKGKGVAENNSCKVALGERMNGKSRKERHRNNFSGSFTCVYVWFSSNA